MRPSVTDGQAHRLRFFLTAHPASRLLPTAFAFLACAAGNKQGTKERAGGSPLALRRKESRNGRAKKAAAGAPRAAAPPPPPHLTAAGRPGPTLGRQPPPLQSGGTAAGAHGAPCTPPPPPAASLPLAALRLAPPPLPRQAPAPRGSLPLLLLRGDAGELLLLLGGAQGLCSGVLLLAVGPGRRVAAAAAIPTKGGRVCACLCAVIPGARYAGS